MTFLHFFCNLIVSENCNPLINRHWFSWSMGILFKVSSHFFIVMKVCKGHSNTIWHFSVWNNILTHSTTVGNEFFNMKAFTDSKNLWFKAFIGSNLLNLGLFDANSRTLILIKDPLGLNWFILWRLRIDCDDVFRSWNTLNCSSTQVVKDNVSNFQVFPCL